MGETLPLPDSQGLDNVHKQRVAEVLSDPESSEKRRSRESLTVDTVKYESGPDGGEEVSMGVEWSGVSTVRSAAPVPVTPPGCLPAVLLCRHCFPQIQYQLNFCKFLSPANTAVCYLFEGVIFFSGAP